MPLIVALVLAVNAVNVPAAGVVPPMAAGTAQVLPNKDEALMVPEPPKFKDAPEPTTIAAIMFVPLVISPNAEEDDPPLGKSG